jgi:hypothetical protein
MEALSGEDVTPRTKSYTGFATPARKGAIVAKDGSTVINYYYPRNLYTLDLNTNVNGTDHNTSTAACKFSVTINGVLVANQVGDFCQQFPYGTSYSIEVYPQGDYAWDGTQTRGSAALSGIIEGGTSIRPILWAEPS